MKRVIVTGTTGFVGANRVRRLLRDGHAVHVFVRPEHSAWRIEKIRSDVPLHLLDLSDIKAGRLLGERSPIIDLDHIILFTTATLSRLAQAQKFTVCEIGRVWNRYTLHYFARLVPIPTAISHWFLAFLTHTLVGRLRLSIPLGNLYLVARKTI